MPKRDENDTGKDYSVPKYLFTKYSKNDEVNIFIIDNQLKL